MKRFVFLCAALMSVAFIYGAVDFMKEKKNGTIGKLYVEHHFVPAPTFEADAEEGITRHEKNRINKKVEPLFPAVKILEPVKTMRSKLSFSEFSRAPLSDEEIAYYQHLQDSTANAEALLLGNEISVTADSASAN